MPLEEEEEDDASAHGDIYVPPNLDAMAEAEEIIQRWDGEAAERERVAERAFLEQRLRELGSALVSRDEELADLEQRLHALGPGEHHELADGESLRLSVSHQKALHGAAR